MVSLGLGSIASVIGIAIQLFLRKGWKTILSLYYLLKKFNLHMVILFVIFVLPEFLGSYGFFTSRGIEWYIAFPSAIGVEAGGSLFTIANNILAFAEGEQGFSYLTLAIGTITSFTTFLWYAYVWYRFLAFLQGMSPVTKITLGIMFLSLTIVITLMVDQYILVEEGFRVSGMTYFLNDPYGSSQPLLDLLNIELDNATNQTINGTNETL